MSRVSVRKWSHVRLNPYPSGSDAWRDWWLGQIALEHVRAWDMPVRCSGCSASAIVLNCVYRREETGSPQIERWCRCMVCGHPWRQITTLMGGAAHALSDIESPMRLEVLRQCVSDSVLGRVDLPTGRTVWGDPL